MKPPLCWFLLLFLLCCVVAPAQDQEAVQRPYLGKGTDAVQLFVDGKPFLSRGGELGNSSASNMDYLRSFWPKLASLNLNTVLAPVYWELMEPVEGQFDFTLLDTLIHSARRHDLRLVLLWFGSWKNSMSCYAPAWVKQNQKRFPRSRISDGEALEILTPFCEENLQADSRAFAALMRHIKEVDARQGTVIMIQVENEIGMIPQARDHCEQAEWAFSRAVPSELLRYLAEHKEKLHPHLVDAWKRMGFPSAGTWEAVFGKGVHTDELFMAWHFARYVDHVAQAGKTVHPLPMYVNAALIRPGYQPGQYPSAGPLPHLIDLWRAGAPQIDFLSPDIYFDTFAEWCSRYDLPGNPLFIPEVAMTQSPANAFYAIAQHAALGYSPFSIESLTGREKERLAQAYDLLRQLEPLIVANQGSGRMVGVLLDSARQESRFTLGDFVFIVRHEHSWAYAQREPGPTPRYGGMILQLSEDEFLIAGVGLVVQLAVAKDKKAKAGITAIDEGSLVDGRWVAGRRLNGDQSHQGRHVQLPGQAYTVVKVKLYHYR